MKEVTDFIKKLYEKSRGIDNDLLDVDVQKYEKELREIVYKFDVLQSDIKELTKENNRLKNGSNLNQSLNKGIEVQTSTKNIKMQEMMSKNRLNEIDRKEEMNLKKQQMIIDGKIKEETIKSNIVVEKQKQFGVSQTKVEDSRHLHIMKELEFMAKNKITTFNRSSYPFLPRYQNLHKNKGKKPEQFKDIKPLKQPLRELKRQEKNEKKSIKI